MEMIWYHLGRQQKSKLDILQNGQKSKEISKGPSS